jgi:aryl-alcohol dehydrogenase-like predicted oxidoreductase
MKTHPYGRGPLKVSVLGLGAGQVGDARLSEAEAGQLLNSALDMGITLIDTARGYGLSEERIGRHLAHRRSEFVLSTKVGYGIPGHADWTGGCITGGIDAALQLLRTERLDIVHLHSCDLPLLQAGEVLGALERAREAGKVGTVAYSGENQALAWAVASGRCGGIECSVNLFDQGSLAGPVAAAQAAGLGVIAKRPLGNAPWRYGERPAGEYCETYWQRLQTLAYDTTGLAWDELALRFAAFQPGVSSAIVGTASLQHLRHNVALVDQGPLPADLVAHLRARFAAVGAGWRGEI